ncbi:TPA: hypothetical protein ACH1TP_002893 [Enterobacter roggenkampii]|nr:hypothetical protein [Lelliottia sp. RWM.1]
MPLATALSNLIVNLSQRFDINYLQQLPLRQLLRLTEQLRKQNGKPPHN